MNKTTIFKIILLLLIQIAKVIVIIYSVFSFCSIVSSIKTVPFHKKFLLILLLPVLAGISTGVHEIGHVCVAKVLCIPIEGIRFKKGYCCVNILVNKAAVSRFPSFCQIMFYSAGPLNNFLLFSLILLLLRFVHVPEIVMHVLLLLSFINVISGIFNLLPISAPISYDGYFIAKVFAMSYKKRRKKF